MDQFEARFRLIAAFNRKTLENNARVRNANVIKTETLRKLIIKNWNEEQIRKEIDALFIKAKET